jgi:hypothetical protein
MTPKKVVLAVALVSSFAMLATTQAQGIEPNEVHIHKAVVALWNISTTSVLVEVTAQCTGGVNGTVAVSLSQTMAQSNAGTAATQTVSGSSTVKCDGKSRTIAVSLGPSSLINIGKADATAMLTVISGNVTDTRTIGVGFPATEHGDDDE